MTHTAGAWHTPIELQCVARLDETSDTTTFELAAALELAMDFHPGQFITLGVTIQGQKHYRAYSMSSSPHQAGRLAVTVKRVPGGLVSNYLLDHVRPGTPLDVLPPAGDFFLDRNHVPDELVLLSAGSGITPMMSISRWLLQTTHTSTVHFIHSARSWNDVIFREELLRLSQAHPQFRCHLVLENANVPDDEPGVDPLGVDSISPGLLTPDRLDDLIRDIRPTAHYYLCGPTPYMDRVSTWRHNRGITDSFFHQERFVAEPLGVPEEKSNSTLTTEHPLHVPAFGKSGTIRSGETLLEALEKLAIPVIGACRSGVCGSCKCRVTKGRVESVSEATLTPDQIAQGVVLACSSHAQGAIAVELV